MTYLGACYLYRQENAYPRPQLMHTSTHTPVHMQSHTHVRTPLQSDLYSFTCSSVNLQVSPVL